MSSALIICKSGVMFSGKLLEPYNSDTKWIGIKPSEKSGICMFFQMERIKKIYFEDGTYEIMVDSDLRQQPKLDLEVPDENLVILRIRGGVSYRGEKLESLPEGVTWREGYWIAPNKKREMIINIPEEEIEKVYAM